MLADVSSKLPGTEVQKQVETMTKEGQFSALTLIRQLKIASNSSYRESEALFWPQWAFSYRHHTHTTDDVGGGSSVLC